MKRSQWGGGGWGNGGWGSGGWGSGGWGGGKCIIFILIYLVKI